MKGKETLIGLSLMTVTFNGCTQEPPERSELPPAERLWDRETTTTQFEPATTEMFEVESEADLFAQVNNAINNEEFFIVSINSNYLRWMTQDDTGSEDDMGIVLKVKSPFMVDALVAGQEKSYIGAVYVSEVDGCAILLNLFDVTDSDPTTYWPSEKINKASSPLFLTTDESGEAAYLTRTLIEIGHSTFLPEPLSRREFQEADKEALIRANPSTVALSC